MKSTFQKPDATYPHGSLREQPEMKKPPTASYGDRREDDISIENWNRYQKHIDSLRTIPCSENNWKDGQELEEGKDYELKEKYFKLSDEQYNSKENQNRDNPINGYIQWVAVPIVQETEDELWGEVKEILKESWVADSFIKKLKSKFTIKRKTS